MQRLESELTVDKLRKMTQNSHILRKVKVNHNQGDFLKENTPPSASNSNFLRNNLQNRSPIATKSTAILGKRENPIEVDDWRMNEEPIPTPTEHFLSRNINQENSLPHQGFSTTALNPRKEHRLNNPGQPTLGTQQPTQPQPPKAKPPKASNLSLKPAPSSSMLMEALPDGRPSFGSPPANPQPLSVLSIFGPQHAAHPQQHTEIPQQQQPPQTQQQQQQTQTQQQVFAGQPDRRRTNTPQHQVGPAAGRDLVLLLQHLAHVDQPDQDEASAVCYQASMLLAHSISQGIAPGQEEQVVRECLQLAKFDRLVGESRLPPEQTPWGILKLWISKLGIQPELLRVGQMLTELSLTDPWLANSPVKTIAAGCLGVILSFRQEKEKHSIIQVSELTKLSFRHLVIATLRVTLLITGDPEPELCPIRAWYGLENLKITLSKRAFMNKSSPGQSTTASLAPKYP